jgi:peroxiredoxin Q/BCP
VDLIVGEEAPDFEYKDNNGNSLNLHQIRGKKVVFFFPKAFSRGCTKEAISIQENYQDLKELGVDEVFGISLDSTEKLKKFCRSHNFEYVMVSDKSKIISKSYGVYRNRIFFKFSDRDTFIIDGDNIIAKVLQNGLTGRKSKLGLHNQGIEIINYLKNPDNEVRNDNKIGDEERNKMLG